MTRLPGTAAVLVVALAMAAGIEGMARGAGQDPGALARDAKTWKVTPSRREVLVSGRGTVEAVLSRSVACDVEGGAVIRRIKPEGQPVRQGEVVVELDSASFRDQLVNQRVRVENVGERHAIATLEREAAELALREYAEGMLPRERADLARTIDGGRDAIRTIERRIGRIHDALQRLEEARRAAGGATTPADIVAEVDLRDRLDEAELGRDRERRALAEAEGRRDVLENFTRPRRIKQLEGAVRKARLEARIEQATLEAEKGRQDRLERQVAACTLVAPIDGLVIHGDDRALIGQRPAIKRGDAVRQRQVVFHVVDLGGPMQVNLKVSEEDVNRVLPRMKARVKVDDLPGETLAGFVGDIAVLPDPSAMAVWDSKVYTTRLQIGRGPAGLRPGMAARADIVVEAREDVLGVPGGAVVRWDDKDHVAVKAPDGRIAWREVVLGGFAGPTVEVREGLRAGEEVILEPQRFLTPEQGASRPVRPR